VGRYWRSADQRPSYRSVSVRPCCECVSVVCLHISYFSALAIISLIILVRLLLPLLLFICPVFCWFPERRPLAVVRVGCLSSKMLLLTYRWQNIVYIFHMWRVNSQDNANICRHTLDIAFVLMSALLPLLLCFVSREGIVALSIRVYVCLCVAMTACAPH